MLIEDYDERYATVLSWRYLRNRLGAAQEILLGCRPVGLDLIIFLKIARTGLFLVVSFFRAPHSTVSLIKNDPSLQY